MGLLDLPAELRLQIFEHLPDLKYGRHEAVGPNYRITPAICRVSHSLRKETLPLYAKTSSFIIETNDVVYNSNNRVQAWLAALGETAISYVQDLQLSRQWKAEKPQPWHHHDGFYVRFQLIDNVWKCTGGTYPIANDIRGMRSESVDLLRWIVLQRLRKLTTEDETGGLSRSDVDFIVEAMGIVSSHPISTYNTDQSESGRKRRMEIWYSMERKLLDLADLPDDGKDADIRLYTPY